MTLRFNATLSRGTFELRADIAMGQGEVTAVLGPNGAGKSSLLRSVAGLLSVDSGSVELGDQVLDDPARGVFIPAERRGLGVVFQDHRLFPHLRVLENVAFGMRARRVSRVHAHAEAMIWLERLGIADLSRRHPRQLSGGQAQRVALARALAYSPGALLLDEPLAALDVQTRAEVQAELHQHLHAFGGPSLLVTHDPLEALLLADKIVVLESGVIVQQGSPTEISSRPATSYIARLVGMNLYQGRSQAGVVTLPGGSTLVATDAIDGETLIAIRPSAFTVHVQAPSTSSARTLWSGQVATMSAFGDRVRLTVGVTGGLTVLVDVTAAAVAELSLRPGESVWLTAKATDLTTYPTPTSH